MGKIVDKELEKSFSDDVNYLENALKGYAFIQIIGLTAYAYFSNVFIDRVSNSEGELFLVLAMLLFAIVGHNIYMFNEFFSAYNYILDKSKKYAEKITKLEKPYLTIFLLSIACQVVAIVCSLQFHPEFWRS